MTIEPNGCRWCGIPHRRHFQQWTETAKWHTWTEPTDDQRLDRMRARRAAGTMPLPTDQEPAP